MIPDREEPIPVFGSALKIAYFKSISGTDFIPSGQHVFVFFRMVDGKSASTETESITQARKVAR